MKKYSLFLTVLLLGLVLTASAQNQSASGPTNAFPAIYNTGTNNGSAFYVAGASVTLPKFTFISGPITNGCILVTNVLYGVTNILQYNTNFIQYNLQFSVDGNNSNWLTVWSWNPSQYPVGSATGSNSVSVIDTPNPATVSFSLPFRVQVATTNGLQVQALKVQ